MNCVLTNKRTAFKNGCEFAPNNSLLIRGPALFHSLAVKRDDQGIRVIPCESHASNKSSPGLNVSREVGSVFVKIVERGTDFAKARPIVNGIGWLGPTMSGNSDRFLDV